MGARTKIEWTEASWNPLRGCTRVSEGCRHCYAETVAARFSGPGQPYEGLATMVERPDGKHEARWTGEVRFIEDRLLDPIRWQKPRRIFVNSMSDLFHESVPFSWIDRIFGVMARSPKHIFQVLTKRPERMQGYLRNLPARIRSMECHVDLDDVELPLPNVWFGVSVDDDETARERIPLLVDTPAAVRWISLEPQLGPVDLTAIDINGDSEMDALNPVSWAEEWERWEGSDPEAWDHFCDWFDLSPSREEGDLPAGNLHGVLDWVVVGGESGAGARPFDLAWARSIVDQCRNAGTPVFVKQLGANPVENGQPLELRDAKGGDSTEWPEDLRVRECPRPKPLPPRSQKEAELV